MQTLPLGIGLLVFSFSAFVPFYLLVGENIVTNLISLTLTLFLFFTGLVIIKRNLIKKNDSSDILTKVFQNIYVVSFISLLYVILGAFLIFAELTASESTYIALYAGLILLPMGVAQILLVYRYVMSKNVSNNLPLDQKHSSTFTALKITILSFVAVLTVFLGGNYVYHEISYRFNPLPEPTIPEGSEPIIPAQIVSIAIESVGCQSLSCIVTTKEKIPVQVITFGPADKIQPSTSYDVFVCTPNCGTGSYFEGWNRRQCTSSKESTLTLNIVGGICY